MPGSVRAEYRSFRHAFPLFCGKACRKERLWLIRNPRITKLMFSIVKQKAERLLRPRRLAAGREGQGRTKCLPCSRLFAAGLCQHVSAAHFIFFRQFAISVLPCTVYNHSRFNRRKAASTFRPASGMDSCLASRLRRSSPSPKASRRKTPSFSGPPRRRTWTPTRNNVEKKALSDSGGALF